MVFSSTIFLFMYLPIVTAMYYLLKDNIRNYWLLFVSLIFFAWAQPNYLGIILLSVLINYVGGIFIEKYNLFKKRILCLTIILNLLLLFYYKYFNFVVDSLNDLFGEKLSVEKIILPIGISFFTFQGISYVIDVYRNEVKAQYNIFKLGLYISLFPQLIAGPIVRYKDVNFEIDHREFDLSEFEYGVKRFIIGLSKKVIIANTLAEMVDSIWNNGVTNNSSMVAWIGSIGYTLQIFFDFSGYSDMAIGLGRMFGFHFNENFNLPYISKNISEFWRRWHISLSTWFRDYVYIPLGGNRKRVYLNLSIVFFLTGIWHGASWTFILWGLYNGLFILIERLIKNNHSPIFNDNGRGMVIKKILSHIYTLGVVNLGWILFRATDVNSAFKYLGIMFGIIKPDRIGFTAFWYLNRWTITIICVAVICSTEIPNMLKQKCKLYLTSNTYQLMSHVLLLVLLLFSMIRIVAGTYNPFIYFQF